MSVFRKTSPYFRFTPKERKGIIVLLVLLVFVFAVRFFAPYLFLYDSVGRITVEEINILEENEKEKQKINITQDKLDISAKLTIDTTLSLNPNIASHSDLIKIGFSNFSASNVIKYREKGGRFYTIEDLFPIYGVDTFHLKSIRKNLIFNTIEKTTSAARVPQLIEINKSNAQLLSKIPCVGPVISKRIIKYRSLLGGFYSVNQLKEVYGIDSLCIKNISDNIEINSGTLDQMNLNTWDEKEFTQHPYISLYQARAIVKYRELIAPFDSLYQLKESNIFTVEEFRKVSVYLSCQSN